MSFNLGDLYRDVQIKENYLNRCVSTLNAFYAAGQYDAVQTKLLEQEIFFVEDQLGMYYQVVKLLQEEPNEKVLQKV